MMYIEVAHIAHEDICQRALAFSVAMHVVAPNDCVGRFGGRGFLGMFPPIN
jgi:hypothetical protein